MADGDIASGAVSGASAGAALGPWGALAGGIIGAGASWYLGQEQGRRQRAESDEALRRIRAQHAQVLGQSTAAAAASGVELESSSLQRYLDSMRSEFAAQEEWAHRAGAAQAGATGLAADIGLFGDLGSSAFRFAQANNWWKTPNPPATPSVF